METNNNIKNAAEKIVQTYKNELSQVNWFYALPAVDSFFEIAVAKVGEELQLSHTELDQARAEAEKLRYDFKINS